MSKEFVTAAKAVAAEGTAEEGLLNFDLVKMVRDAEGNEVEGERRTLYAHRPDDGQLSMLMAVTSSMADKRTKVAGIINFFVAVMDEDDHAYITSRLLDRHDPFGIEEVTSILFWMIEEWTGNPTDEPSGSTPSRPSGGRKSTRRTPALT